MFKTHFLTAQHILPLQQKTSRQAGFQSHTANSVINQQQLVADTSKALCNLATATASDCKALETLTNTIVNLTQQLKDKDGIIKKLQQTSPTNSTKRPFTQEDMGSYCHTHGYHVDKGHTSKTCKNQKENYKEDATRNNNMEGNQEGKPT
jgi:hypothetical protein